MLRRKATIVLIALCSVPLLWTVASFIWAITVEVPRIMGDSSALWNVTDALTLHIRTDEKWPDDWSQLSSTLAFVNPSYESDGLSFAQDRVAINFDVDIDAPQGENESYVRLKSGRMQPEEERANKRILQSIESHQSRSRIGNESELRVADPL